MGDAQRAYAGRLKRFDRHVLFLRPRAGDEAMAVIYDELESARASTFQWWLHAIGQMEVDPEAQAATIRRGAARLKVHWLLPQGLTFEQTQGYPVAPTTPNFVEEWHLTAHAVEPAAARQFLTVLLPYREGVEAALPEVRLLEGERCHALTLRTAETRHVVLFRRAGQTGPMRAGGLESDAALLAVGFDTAGGRVGEMELR